MKTMVAASLCATMASLCAAEPGLSKTGSAKISGLKKSTLQRIDYPPPHDATLMIKTVVRHSGIVPPHVHPGVEMGYVLEGSCLVRIAGRTNRRYSAGGSFVIPPRTVHSVVNTGDGRLVVLTTYVVDRRKPIITLVQ